MTYTFLPQQTTQVQTRSELTAKGIRKTGIHLDSPVPGLFDNRVESRGVDFWNYLRAWGALDAMDRPEPRLPYFRRVGGIGHRHKRLVWLVIWRFMVGSEGDVVGGMEIFRCNFQDEWEGE